MKNTNPLIALACSLSLLTACGDASDKDQALPEGTAPNDSPAERSADPDPQSSLDAQTDRPKLGDADPQPKPEVTLPPSLPTPEGDAERSQAPGMTYVLPKGWTQTLPKSPNAMRAATLVPPAAFENAELAVFIFPRDVGGFVLNVNRWVGQIGLSEFLPDFPGLITAANSDFEQFTLDGHTATWIPLMNEENNLAILAVWLPIGEDPESPEQTWTFKLTCQADQVEALAPAMRAWCESIQFD